jgi:hypothetical protein
MPTPPLDSNQDGIAATDGAWHIERRRLPAVQRSGTQPEDVDLVAELGGLGAEPGDLEALGLADNLIAWLAPRLRTPDTLTQARIVPLLGAAADLLSRSAQVSPDIARLGARALEQELRMQAAIAERRATLVLGRAE